MQSQLDQSPNPQVQQLQSGSVAGLFAVLGPGFYCCLKNGQQSGISEQKCDSDGKLVQVISCWKH